MPRRDAGRPWPPGVSDFSVGEIASSIDSSGAESEAGQNYASVSSDARSQSPLLPGVMGVGEKDADFLVGDVSEIWWSES